MIIFQARIQLRRDTAANWTAADPTLAEAEIGYETDTAKWKIGDGATAWTVLGYAYTPPATSGTYSINNGVDSGSVTGLGLAYVPSQCLLTVRIPVGGLLLFPVCIGAPTADGFDFSLSGVTDSANYKLDYTLVP